MRKKLSDIMNFKCPRWEEIPDKQLFSSQLIEYLNDRLNVLIMEDSVLTKAMIQNYFKWEILPEIVGRKYSREHIAYLIVISIYKQVIPIKDIKKGVLLQQNYMRIEEAYNLFSEFLERAIKEVFSSLQGNKPCIFPSRQVKKEHLGIDAVTYAFAFQLLGITILKANGTKEIEVNNE